MHHSMFIFEEHKLPFNEGFGQNICNFLIYGNIMKLHCSLLDPISIEVIFYLYMFVPIMEYWILQEFDITLIVHHCRLQILIK
jgi:hypothetical protein